MQKPLSNLLKFHINPATSIRIMALYIAFSGGHRQSVALGYDDEKNQLFGPEVGNSLNLHCISEDSAATRLSSLLTRLKPKHLSKGEFLSSARKVVLSMPGAGIETDQNKAKRVLDNVLSHEVERRVIDDTWAGLFAETLKEDGICAFAGTGASIGVALGEFKLGKKFKIDGWGPVIGDFGSAFRLVTSFFAMLGRQLDEGRVLPLFEEVRKSCPSLPNIEGVQVWFDTLCRETDLEWRVQFAELAKPIRQRAESKDPDAEKLVEASARELVQSLQIAFRSFGSQLLTKPIVLQGEMFEESLLYTKTVTSGLADMGHESHMAQLRPIVGALLLACANDALLMTKVRNSASGVSSLRTDGPSADRIES